MLDDDDGNVITSIIIITTIVILVGTSHVAKCINPTDDGARTGGPATHTHTWASVVVKDERLVTYSSACSTDDVCSSCMSSLSLMLLVGY